MRSRSVTSGNIYTTFLIMRVDANTTFKHAGDGTFSVYQSRTKAGMSKSGPF